MGNVTVNSGFGAVLAVLTAAFGVVVSIFWMWVGWRAMRAHERIADSLQDTGQTHSSSPRP